jgi:hypothetical protein
MRFSSHKRISYISVRTRREQLASPLRRDRTPMQTWNLSSRTACGLYLQVILLKRLLLLRSTEVRRVLGCSGRFFRCPDSRKFSTGIFGVTSAAFPTRSGQAGSTRNPRCGIFRDASLVRQFSRIGPDRAASPASTRARGFRVVLVSQRQSIAASAAGHCLLHHRGHDRRVAARLLEAPGH